MSIVFDKKHYEIRNYVTIFITCFNRDPNIPQNFQTFETVWLEASESISNML